MSEFFLELFSEEIPSSLQKNLRKDLLDEFNKLFDERFISFKKSASYDRIMQNFFQLGAESFVNTVCQNKGPSRVYENRKIQRSFQGSFG